MHRLKTLKTTSGGGNVLQNITYSYDDVGNILGRNNSEFNTADSVKRNSSQRYGYDSG